MKFSAYGFSLIFLAFGSTMAPAHDDNAEPSSSSIISSHWDIQHLMVRGGSFWTGYNGHTVDFPSHKLSGFWDSRDENSNIVTQEKSRTISEKEQKAIIQQLGNLEEATVDASQCLTAADGPEEYLLLQYRSGSGEEHELTVVAEPSLIFVCGDKYASADSFRDLRQLLNELLPRP